MLKNVKSSAACTRDQCARIWNNLKKVGALKFWWDVSFEKIGSSMSIVLRPSFARVPGNSKIGLNHLNNCRQIKWMPAITVHIFPNAKVTSNINSVHFVTPFSSMGFHDSALSHGMIYFAWSDSFKNHLNRSFWLAVKRISASHIVVSGANTRNRTPCDQA